MIETTLAELVKRAEPRLAKDEVLIARGYLKTLKADGIESFAQLVRDVGDAATAPAVRLIGCRLWGWLGDSTARTGLERTLEDAQDEGLMWEAARALARLHAEQATPALVRVLNLGTPQRQSAAAWALGWLGAPAAISSLRAVVMNDRLPIDVRAHATEALG